VAFAIDGEKDLLQMPLVAGSGTPLTELIGIRLAKLAAPLAAGFVGHDHAACQEQLFHITVAEAEADVQPDAIADDLGRKPMVCVWAGWRNRTFYTFIIKNNFILSILYFSWLDPMLVAYGAGSHPARREPHPGSRKAAGATPRLSQRRGALR
jgi:hypothetical protein